MKNQNIKKTHKKNKTQTPAYRYKKSKQSTHKIYKNKKFKGGNDEGGSDEWERGWGEWVNQTFLHHQYYRPETISKDDIWSHFLINILYRDYKNFNYDADEKKWFSMARTERTGVEAWKKVGAFGSVAFTRTHHTGAGAGAGAGQEQEQSWGQVQEQGLE